MSNNEKDVTNANNNNVDASSSSVEGEEEAEIPAELKRTPPPPLVAGSSISIDKQPPATANTQKISTEKPIDALRESAVNSLIDLNQEKEDSLAGLGQASVAPMTAEAEPGPPGEEEQRRIGEFNAKAEMLRAKGVYVLSDSRDYASIRMEKRLPDPFILYGRGFKVTDVYQDAEDESIKRFHMLSPEKDSNQQPMSTHTYILADTIGADEVARLLNDAKEQNMMASKAASAALIVSSSSSSAAKASPTSAAAQAQQTPYPQVPIGPITASPASAAAASNDDSERRHISKEMRAQMEQMLELEAVSDELKDHMRKELGLQKVVANAIDKDGLVPVSDRILPFVKIEKGRDYMAALMLQNKGIMTAVADVGLQAILVSFQLAKMNPDEMRNTILSFNRPDDLIGFVTDKLSDAFYAATEDHQENFERMQEELAQHVRYEKQLEADNRKLDYAKLNSEYQLEIAMACFAAPQELNAYYSLVRLSTSPMGRQKVQDFIIQRQLATAMGEIPGFNPPPNNGHAQGVPPPPQGDNNNNQGYSLEDRKLALKSELLHSFSKYADLDAATWVQMAKEADAASRRNNAAAGNRQQPPPDNWS